MKHFRAIFLIALSLFFGLRLGVAENTQPATSLRLLPGPVKEGQLAFSYFSNGQSDIYIVDFASSQILPFVTSPKNDEYPRWSLDRSRLAFYSNRSGNNEIYTVSKTGEDLKQITNSPASDEDPSWSSDGKKIVFQSSRQNKGLNLYVVDSNGGTPVALTTVDKRTTVPDWSPDGKTIIFSTDYYWPGWDLVLFDVATKKTSRITEGVLSYCRATWLADSSAIVYSEGADDSINIKMRLMSSGKETVLTTGPGRKYDAVFSNSGAFVFYVQELEPGRGDFQIFVHEVDGEKSTQLTEGPGSIRYLSFNHSSTTPVPPAPAPPAPENIAPVPSVETLPIQPATPATP